MKILYTAKVTATGGRDGRAKSADGILDVALATPKELGGPGGQATNPEQLFAAGYSACFDSAMRHVARMQKISIQKTEVTAAVGIGPVEGGFGLQVDMAVSLPELSQKQAEDLVATAHKVCPYSNATRGNIAVNITVTGGNG